MCAIIFIGELFNLTEANADNSISTLFGRPELDSLAQIISTLIFRSEVYFRPLNRPPVQRIGADNFQLLDERIISRSRTAGSRSIAVRLNSTCACVSSSDFIVSSSDFIDKVLAKAEAAGLTSDEHFSVDGTLIEAWASHKSFRPKDSDDNQDPPSGNAGQNFRGEKRSNATHQSTTDTDARLHKKSKGDAAKMALMGHVLSENRHGLVVNAKVTLATGKAERHAAVAMVVELGGEKRLTLCPA